MLDDLKTPQTKDSNRNTQTEENSEDLNTEKVFLDSCTKEEIKP